MEQEAVFDLGEFDERNISLDETPRDALHYLQQVAVSRARCPQVVTARIIPQEHFSPALTENTMFRCEAPTELSLVMCHKFSMQRSHVDAQRPLVNKITNFRWPGMKDPETWRVFCLEKRSDRIPLEQKDIPWFAQHYGNPPTLRLVLSLSEKQVNLLLQHLIEVFVDKGYSRPLFEWIFALLLVLQKPLLHDVCAALRVMAKHARLLRSTLENGNCQENGPIDEEFSLLIAVVGVYFEQKDLADQISS